MSQIERERIYIDIDHELDRTFEKWGDQSHVIDGTGAETRVMGYSFKSYARIMKRINDAELEVDAQTGAMVPNTPKWSIILLEEVFEALESDDPEHLREELVQVASVATNWLKHIDARSEGRS